MFTVNLEDGRTIRVRQPALGGYLILSLLSAPKPDCYLREVEREISVDPKILEEALLKAFDENADMKKRVRKDDVYRIPKAAERNLKK